MTKEQEFIAEVYRKFNVLQYANTRKRERIYVTQCVCNYFLKEKSKSLTAISKITNKDHATVLWNIRQHNNNLIYKEYRKLNKSITRYCNKIYKEFLSIDVDFESKKERVEHIVNKLKERIVGVKYAGGNAEWLEKRINNLENSLIIKEL